MPSAKWRQSLRGDPFDQHRQPSVAHPAGCEPGVAHQTMHLLRRAFPTPFAADNHEQVAHRSHSVRTASFVVPIDRDDFRPGRHGGANPLEDVAASVVAPVVQDPLHRVDVRAGVQLTEQVAGATLDPVGQPAFAQEPVGLLYDVGRIEKDAASVGPVFKDGRKHVPDPTCHIADDTTPRPRIGPHHVGETELGD